MEGKGGEGLFDEVRRWMDGWMDGSIYSFEQIDYLITTNSPLGEFYRLVISPSVFLFLMTFTKYIYFIISCKILG